MWIRNAWYVAGWASEIAADGLVGRTYLNTPVVLYRDAAGAIVALEDRCCHRHAPLSKGRLEGENLRCMYHGLKFDPSGRCIEVPGEETVPPVMKVRRFPVVEKDTLVWIWLGDPAQADPADIVDWPYLGSPDWRHSEGYLYYDADYRLIVDNLLDFTHLGFVHATTIGSSGAAATRPASDRTDHGLRIHNHWKNEDPAPHHRAVGMSGKVDRWNVYDWHYRGNLLLMDAGSTPTGSPGYEGDRSEAIQFRHISVLTPETERTTHYHYAHCHDFGLDDEALSQGIVDALVAAFNEDKDIIEAQQRVIDLDPGRPMIAAPFDGPLTHIRRRVDEAIATETAPEAVAAE